jgi:hypothetical protein
MKKVMAIIFLLVPGHFGQARSCVAPGPERRAQGTFMILDVSPAEIKCLSKTAPFDRSKKAPGCLLKVKRATPAKNGENQSTEFLVYGGDGSCSMKVGQSFTNEISDHCCVGRLNGCLVDERRHSDEMWGCNLNAFYKNDVKKGDPYLFPADSDDEDTIGHPDRLTPEKTDWLHSIQKWFSGFF